MFYQLKHRDKGKKILFNNKEKSEKIAISTLQCCFPVMVKIFRIVVFSIFYHFFFHFLFY